MTWTPETTFFLAAALVQLAVGLAIVVRRPQVEWAVVLAALFCLNGALSLNALFVLLGLYEGGVPGDGFLHPGSRIAFTFDRLTNLLILYLALAYPQRPAWASSRPWLLPALFVFLALTVLVPFHAGVDYLRPIGTSVRCGSLCNQGTWFSVWTQDVLSLGVPLLILRWAYLLPRTRSPLELRHLALLLAAFAMRVVHVELTFQTLAIGRFVTGHDSLLLLTPQGLADLARSTLASLALAAFAVLLARAYRSGGSDQRKAVRLVAAFALVGLAEAALTRTLDVLRGGFPYFYGPLLALDSVVVRPAVVVYGIIRQDLFGPAFAGRRAKTVGVLLVSALPTFALMELFLQGTTAPATASLLSSSLVAIVVAGGAYAALRPSILGEEGSAGRLPLAATAAYLALLDEAYRNQRPSQRDLDRLAGKRQQLGITDGQAAALEAAVRTRWAGTVGPAAWNPGETFAGRYRIEAPLGDGGTAETYLADDLVDDVQVVLKRTQHLDPGARRSLVREAFVLSRLAHPNIVRLLRTEQSGEETILVLEYLAGGSLKDRLARGPLRPAAAERLLAEMLQALQAAHGSGVRHGDVKPANILFDGQGRAKLADFGIARTEALPNQLVDVTVTGAVGPGSLRYMSPEQVRGLPADARSDLFSLGLVVAEALGGEPLPGHPGTDYEVRQALVQGGPPRLPKVPPRLASVVLALTERPPARRPASAGRALALLEGPGSRVEEQEQAAADADEVAAPERQRRARG